MIGSTIKIKGVITGDEDLVIAGKVDGSVQLSEHNLTIAKSAQIVADVYAKTVTVEGQVKGDIYGNQKVFVANSGRVFGNITAPRVTLEDGANFKGNIDMNPGAAEKASIKPGPQAAAAKGAEGQKARSA